MWPRKSAPQRAKEPPDLPQPSTDNAAEDLPICRICFAGADNEAGDEGLLVSPCRCEGSQKFVHLSCLRHWQRSVQLGGSNHPEDTVREDRHQVCNVCKSAFNLPPQDRGSMMSELAHVRPEEIAPGILLVTKKTGAASSMASAQMNIALRAFIETRAAHFREAVYLITDIRPAVGSDGSDAVLGVNLSRPLETPDVSKLEGAANEADIQECARMGVEVLWMNGGPLRPRAVTTASCVERLPLTQRQELFAQHGIRELATSSSSGQVLIEGPMTGVLAVAMEEARQSTAAAARINCRHDRERATPSVTVIAWAGVAQWSRTQLLGEVARGSWGWCRGTPADVSAAALVRRQPEGGAANLWDALRYSDRLQWAPDNELSRDYESRFHAVPEAPNEPDPHAEAVGALVREFEALRRGSEPSSSQNTGRWLRSSRQQTCTPQ